MDRIDEYFTKASETGNPNEGLRIFKRKLMGLFRRKTVKNLDEIAQILYDMGVVPSVETGRELIPDFAKSTPTYVGPLASLNKIRFSEIRDRDQIKYEISVCGVD